MKVNVEIEIFDDPEFCMDFKIGIIDERCEHLKITRCCWFKKTLISKYNNSGYQLPKKCDQCKKASQKAKGGECHFEYISVDSGTGRIEWIHDPNNCKCDNMQNDDPCMFDQGHYCDIPSWLDQENCNCKLKSVR